MARAIRNKPDLSLGEMTLHQLDDELSDLIQFGNSGKAAGKMFVQAKRICIEMWMAYRKGQDPCQHGAFKDLPRLSSTSLEYRLGVLERMVNWSVPDPVKPKISEYQEEMRQLIKERKLLEVLGVEPERKGRPF